MLQRNTRDGKGHCCLTTWRRNKQTFSIFKMFPLNCRACQHGVVQKLPCLKISNWWPPYWRGCCVSKLSSLGYCLPFSAPLCHISDRAGSHQKFTWHWAFCSIPKRITSSTHMATVISVEAKKMKSYCPPPSPPDFSKNHYCSNTDTAVAGGEGGGQEQTKNGYFKMPLFFRGSGKPLYFKKNDSNKSPRRR